MNFGKFFGRKPSWLDDADGDVFRSLQADGFDFGKEYTIDFNIDFNHWPVSDDVIQLIKTHHPNAQVVHHDAEDLAEGRNVGFIQFQLREQLTYELVMEVQNQTTELLKEHGGSCESWGVMN